MPSPFCVAHPASSAGRRPSRRLRWYRTGAHVAAWTLALGFAVACSDDDDGDGTTTPQTGTFTMAVAAPSVTTVGLAPSTVAVNITRANGFTGGVTLAATGLPAFVNAVFTPGVIPAGSTTSALTLTPLPIAGITTGPFPFTITGSATGLTAQSTAMTVVITPSTLALVATPATLTIAAGASGTTTVGITRSPGDPSNPVTLTLFTGPEGITVTQSPLPTTGNTAVLTIAVASTVAPGTYTVVVRSGAFGTGDATVSIGVTVTR
jgi:hypothetical protein